MRFFYCLAGVLLATAGVARAEPTKLESPTGEPWMVVVPPGCEQFVPKVGNTHPTYWNQWLSLAACTQDMPPVVIGDPSVIPDMLDKLQNGIVPALLLYGEAVEHGPDDVKLRAVFHIGLAGQSLLTRARCAITDPALLAELEPLLDPAKQITWLAYSVVDDQARKQPALASDPVLRNMIRSARTMLHAVEPTPEPPPPPRIQTVRALLRNRIGR